MKIWNLMKCFSIHSDEDNYIKPCKKHIAVCIKLEKTLHITSTLLKKKTLAEVTMAKSFATLEFVYRLTVTWKVVSFSTIQPAYHWITNSFSFITIVIHFSYPFRFSDRSIENIIIVHAKELSIPWSHFTWWAPWARSVVDAVLRKLDSQIFVRVLYIKSLLQGKKSRPMLRLTIRPGLAWTVLVF